MHFSAKILFPPQQSWAGSIDIRQCRKRYPASENGTPRIYESLPTVLKSKFSWKIFGGGKSAPCECTANNSVDSVQKSKKSTGHIDCILSPKEHRQNHFEHIFSSTHWTHVYAQGVYYLILTAVASVQPVRACALMVWCPVGSLTVPSSNPATAIITT